MIQISHNEIAPGIVVVTISGKVMLGPESEAITTLVSDLLRQGKGTIIFDLAGIVRIDSTGIGRFISSYNQITAARGEMRMAGAVGHIFQAFHACRLDTIFRFYPTLEEACQPGISGHSESNRFRDQLKGQTTEHATPPRLEDEGQSGG